MKEPQEAARLAVSIIGLTILVTCSASPYIRLRDENRANLVKLEFGMTKAQAAQIVGDNAVTGRYGTFSNPYKREIIKAPTGETMTCCTTGVVLGNAQLGVKVEI